MVFFFPPVKLWLQVHKMCDIKWNQFNSTEYLKWHFTFLGPVHVQYRESGHYVKRSEYEINTESQSKRLLAQGHRKMDFNSCFFSFFLSSAFALFFFDLMIKCRWWEWNMGFKKWSYTLADNDQAYRALVDLSDTKTPLQHNVSGEDSYPMMCNVFVWLIVILIRARAKEAEWSINPSWLLRRTDEFFGKSIATLSGTFAYLNFSELDNF